ncbi:uncharacterized protein PADG_01101 [Paracoccidioides brasiliensis Pb18]|uniref:Chromosome condensation protein n=1 Tax=Paracoccidioides brasiliensis (strain Pb18) TaxID=502780 RepID=C1FZ75_PARBD|nr:uncharacterized protein PADG_01101 [Paracoccidioides brasiliensis Pb18]EEH44812.2 hypothetical protein PADG_01101 [Paracoccidioides brasiliensis Pb18]
MDDEKSRDNRSGPKSRTHAQQKSRFGMELSHHGNLEGERSGWRREHHRENKGVSAGLTKLSISDAPENADDELQRECTREEEIQDTERTESLTELAVPPPIGRVPSHRGDWAALESAESRVTTPVPSAENVTRSETRLSKCATHLYTISYLVLFSILGVLARIGMEWLTSYPGAPLTTGVTWANVGGCLCMGFLAEDRKLFREEWGQWRPKHSRRESTKSNIASNRSARKHSPHPVRPHSRRYFHYHSHHQRQQQEQNEQHEQPERKEEQSEQPLDPAQSLERHKAVKKTIPLYIGLTTGFCGSFTSFSTFMLDVFLSLANDLPIAGSPYNPITRNGGYSFMAVLAIIIYTLSLSLSALLFGAHLAIFIDEYTPIIPYLFTRKFLDPLAVFLASGCWLGAAFLAIWPPDRSLGVHEYWRGRAVFAIVFAPLGCLFRFNVSLLLNARIPKFPLGTFAANIFGTMVLAMCYDLQRATRVVALSSASSSSYASAAAAIAAGAVSVTRLTGCQVLQGVIDGFCGCATTVSTWVAELDSLEHEHAYFYGLVTVAVALGVLVITIGLLKWTVGFGLAVC